MNNDNKRDPIPEEFVTYQAAGEFWDTHDLTDYLDDTEEISARIGVRESSNQIEIDPLLVSELRRIAQQRGVHTADVVNDLLRKQLSAANSK